MSAPGTIVIVGAGQAGASAATQLRELGFGGRIVLVGAEAYAPYERPPLSKAVLCDEVEPTCSILPPDFLTAQSVEFLSETVVEALDADNRCLRLSGGNTLDFDRCLLATGGMARQLDQFPATASSVFYLRGLDDARRLRTALAPGKRVLVIGGGFLGLELACAAQRRGAKVSVAEAGSLLLGRFIPPALSKELAQMLIGRGIDVLTETTVGSAVPAAPTNTGGSAWTVGLKRTASSEQRPGSADTSSFDMVIVSVGLTPSVELARAAGLTIDAQNGGVQINERGQTSHAAIYSAGDCASQYRPAFKAQLRLESWQNAIEQGKLVAASMLEQPAPPAVYPWFWTDLGETNLQMLGMAADDLIYVKRSESDEPMARQLWLGLRGGVPVHGIAVNAGGDLRQIRALFERGLPVDDSGFRDTSVAIRAWAKAEKKSAPQGQ